MGNYIISQGGLLNTSWDNARHIKSSYVSLSGITIRCIFAFSGLSLYLFLTKRKKAALVILALLFLMVLLTRNRVQMIPVLVFPIVIVLLKMKKIRPYHIVLGAIMAVAAIYLVYAFRAFRWLGTLENAIANFSWERINSLVVMFLRDQSGELGLRRAFYYFIDNNNDFEGFGRGDTYIRMLMVFLPSKLAFGIKPESFDLTMGQALGMASGGSYHPTLFGDCFGNLGWIGVSLGAFWAVFCNAVDYIIERQRDDFFKMMIYFLAAYAFVVMGRGSVYNGFQVLAWGVLILYLIEFALGYFKKYEIKIAFYI